MKNIAITVLVFAAFSTSALAENWPHWRGDKGNGISLTAKPPIEWSPTKNVKWKVPIAGRGSGSPVIWESRIFVVTAVAADGSVAKSKPVEPQRAVGERRPRGGRGGRGRGGGEALSKLDFKLLCFNRANGDLIWEKTATSATPHQSTHKTNGFASASPCTDGQHVYAHFGSRGLFCYTMDGELKWKRDDLGEMETRASFGEGSSPTLVDDKIIVPWDHEGPSFIAALNKQTGETIWTTPRDEPTCWATPLIVNHAGKKQIVMNGQNKARAYDLETGKELWNCAGQTSRPAASAVALGDLVYVGSGYQGSYLGAFQLGGRGDIEGTNNVAWSINHDTPDIASPVLSDAGRLYMHKGKSGIISCLDARTGKPHYMTARLPKLKTIYASPIVANGHVYFTGRSGTTIVVKDADQLQVIATNSVGETVDATPAPVDNQLFIRGESHLFCIAE